MIEHLIAIVTELLRQQPEPDEDGVFFLADVDDSGEFEVSIITRPERGGVTLQLQPNSNEGDSVEIEIKVLEG